MAKRFKKSQILIRKEAEKCSACSGSGYYDAKGSPECDACNGTGFKCESD